ncbi:MAG: hypothetical protein Q4A15_04080, partial [Prevotellaceae bacterium]|nr:hypothetical protein [Prevotellaceae bacterium]
MEKAFIKPYEQGWASKPAENSWVTPQIMDNYDQAINEIDNRVIGINEDLTQFIDDGFLPKNLFSAKLVNGDLNNSNGEFTSIADGKHLATSDYIKVEPNTTYTFSHNHSFKGTGTFKILPYGENKASVGARINPSSTASSYTFTTSATTYFIRVAIYDEGGVESNVEVMLVLGTEASTYIPYAMPNTELTQIVDDLDASMKMLGWTLPKNLMGMNYIDSNGIFHQRIDRIDASKLNWSSFTLTIGTKGLYTTSISSLIKKTDGSAIANIYLHGYESTTTNSIYTSNLNKKICVDSSGTVRVADSSATSVSGYIYYELATEKTINMDGNESISVLKENLTPNGYISSGLTYTNCSYVNGGYCKIGNLVVINMRVTATNPTFNVSGFPSYSGFIPVNSVALNVFDA